LGTHLFVPFRTNLGPCNGVFVERSALRAYSAYPRATWDLVLIMLAKLAYDISTLATLSNEVLTSNTLRAPLSLHTTRTVQYMMFERARWRSPLCLALLCTRQ
jgi:hypothetical protein